MILVTDWRPRPAAYFALITFMFVDTHKTRTNFSESLKKKFDGQVNLPAEGLYIHEKSSVARIGDRFGADPKNI